MVTLHEARALLVTACARLGVPPPPEDEGLAAWASGCFDTALAPRGSPDWQRAHDRMIDALEAALHGYAQLVDASLAAAFAVFRERARRVCACADRGATVPDVLGRGRCAKCLGRQDH